MKRALLFVILLSCTLMGATLGTVLGLTLVPLIRSRSLETHPAQDHAIFPIRDRIFIEAEDPQVPTISVTVHLKAENCQREGEPFFILHQRMSSFSVRNLENCHWKMLVESTEPVVVRQEYLRYMPKHHSQANILFSLAGAALGALAVFNLFPRYGVVAPQSSLVG